MRLIARAVPVYVLAVVSLLLTGLVPMPFLASPGLAASCESELFRENIRTKCKNRNEGPKRERTPPKKDRDGSGRGGGNRNGDNSDRDRRDNNADSGPRACQLLEGDPGSRARQCERRRPPAPDRDSNSPPDTDFYVEPPPDVTWEDVGETSIPPSDIFVMPEGWGVVNKPVAVWAGNNSSRTETMELAGYTVEIRVTPAQYKWNFGDGNTTTTTSAGRKPRYAHDADISHSYTESGEYTINLTTSYVGQFRVDGGAWEDIPGTAEIASTPVPVEIYRYVRYLVDENCTKNPDGPDCP